MIDMIVDAGKLPKNKPSTVIDATEPEIKILRRGDLITTSAQTIISKSEKETEKIAEFILNKCLNPSTPFGGPPSLDRAGLKKPIVFGLSGELGCGKTVFSRQIGSLLGVKEKITSPTFVIYNEYSISLQNPPALRAPSLEKGGLQRITKFLHFDLYRLGNEYEFEEIKFLEQFVPGSISCIEWPENMGEKNFENLKKLTTYIAVEFRYIDEKTREIKF
jgi:L-threonylcarbamoyladenylate synthase